MCTYLGGLFRTKFELNREPQDFAAVFFRLCLQLQRDKLEGRRFITRIVNIIAYLRF
jgi:hypothetical protein